MRAKVNLKMMMSKHQHKQLVDSESPMTRSSNFIML